MNRKLPKKSIIGAVSIALCILTVLLGYYTQRADFHQFIGLYAAFFVCYIVVLWLGQRASGRQLRWWLALGIALRIGLLFALPQLSDDFYRFLWDGRLTAAGWHPFAYTPNYLAEQQILPRGLSLDLWARLNSPQYFTVYPPVCQAVFALAGWLSPHSITGGVLVLKLFLLFCEIGTLSLLARANWAHVRCHPALLYALNPLIIMEIGGNCHFEGAMIFFMVAGFQVLSRANLPAAAGCWALAVASKLTPLMFLPLIWAHLGWQRGARFVLWFGAACGLLFSGLLHPQVLMNMATSLDLYFRQFEFNASVYYLLRGSIFARTGYNAGEEIGPLMGLTVILGILLLAWRIRRGLDFYRALLWASMLHLTFSTTVHPWYVTVPFALSLFTSYRFALVWTALIALSYGHYAGGFFTENHFLIALEYVALWAVVVWEWRHGRLTVSG